MTKIRSGHSGNPSGVTRPGEETQKAESAELSSSGRAAAAPYNTRRGTLWSISAGLCIFAAILYAVWSYLYPRLSGEVIAVTSDVGFHEILSEASDAAREWKSRDGTSFLLGKIPVLTAKDLATFQPRIVFGSSDQKQIELTIVLSGEGKIRLEEFAARRITSDGGSAPPLDRTPDDDSSPATVRKSAGPLGMVIHGHFVGVVSDPSPQSGRISVSLSGLTRDEVEEIFARLTE